MKINNLSNVSFKSVYVVDDGFQKDPSIPMRRDIAESLSQTKRNTEVLYDLLKVGGPNRQLGLIKNGGLFKHCNSVECFADAIEMHSSPLMLIDDEISTPVKEVGDFVHQAHSDLAEVTQMDIPTLKSKLSVSEIQQVIADRIEARTEGMLNPEKFDYEQALLRKLRTKAALEYKALYDKLAKQAITLKSEAIEGTKNVIMSAAKSLTQYRK